MSIQTINIDGNPYISYASVAEANTRLRVDLTLWTAWNLLNDDEKGIRLVAATNFLDTLDWKGERTGNKQANAWPRTGIVLPDGTAIDDNDLPVQVEEACALIAGSSTTDPSHVAPANPASNIRSVQAGEAEVEFFTPQTGERPVIQNQHALELVKVFLRSTSVGQTGAGRGSTFIAGRDESTQPFNRTEGF